MAIVSQECINNLKTMHQGAKNKSSYESGYHLAQQGLASAIAQLEQLKMLTESFEVVLRESK